MKWRLAMDRMAGWIQAHRMRARWRWSMLGMAALMVFGLAGMPHMVWAACTYDNSNHQPGIVTFNAGTITLTLNQNPNPNTPIWTSNTNAVPPGAPLVLDCSGSTNSGIVNDLAGPPT